MTGTARKGTFKKGDPRINRNGRPKTFDSLRKLARQIGHEVAKDGSGQPIQIDGQLATATEVILRQWATSDVPALQMKFIEVAYGKVPDEVLVSGKKGSDAIQVNFIDYRAGLGDGSSTPEE